MADMRIKREGDKVLLFKDGTLVATMPYEAAKAVGDALRKKANEAEHHANPKKIITDQAIMVRTGAPFGLTSDPVLQSEAFKEAELNRGLRRYIPHVKERVTNSRPEKFGVPRVAHAPETRR
jgi:hypothetical protein